MRSSLFAGINSTDGKLNFLWTKPKRVEDRERGRRMKVAVAPKLKKENKMVKLITSMFTRFIYKFVPTPNICRSCSIFLKSHPVQGFSCRDWSFLAHFRWNDNGGYQVEVHLRFFPCSRVDLIPWAVLLKLLTFSQMLDFVKQDVWRFQHPARSPFRDGIKKSFESPPVEIMLLNVQIHARWKNRCSQIQNSEMRKNDDYDE